MGSSRDQCICQAATTWLTLWHFAQGGSSGYRARKLSAPAALSAELVCRFSVWDHRQRGECKVHAPCTVPSDPSLGRFVPLQSDRFILAQDALGSTDATKRAWDREGLWEAPFGFAVGGCSGNFTLRVNPGGRGGRLTCERVRPEAHLEAVEAQCSPPDGTRSERFSKASSTSHCGWGRTTPRADRVP